MLDVQLVDKDYYITVSNRRDVRDDRALRILIEGRCQSVSDVSFGHSCIDLVPEMIRKSVDA